MKSKVCPDYELASSGTTALQYEYATITVLPATGLLTLYSKLQPTRLHSTRTKALHIRIPERSDWTHSSALVFAHMSRRSGGMAGGLPTWDVVGVIAALGGLSLITAHARSTGHVLATRLRVVYPSNRGPMTNEKHGPRDRIATTCWDRCTSLATWYLRKNFRPIIMMSHS